MPISEAAKQKLAEHKERKAERRRKRQEQAANANVFSPGRQVVWRPQPGPQTALITCPYPEILFGGARGGGKSDGMIGAWLYHAGKYGEDARGIIFRRRFKQLESLQDRCSQLFPKLGALYNKGDATWVFPNGAVLKLRHLWDEAACEEYQGHAYCVGTGTPILMWDGTYLPIEEIRPGDFVMTLEGPKPVLEAVKVGVKACVLAEVYDASGAFVGAQIHPESHPVLSSVLAQTQLRSSENQGGVLYQTPLSSAPSQEPSRVAHQDSACPANAGVRSACPPLSSDELPHTQFDDCIGSDGQQPECHAPWQSYTLLRSSHRESQEASVYQGSARTDYREFVHERRESPPLPPLSVPVVLHVPSRLSGQPCLPSSIQSRSVGISSGQLERKYQGRSKESLGRPLLCGHAQSHQDHSTALRQAYDVSDVLHGLRRVRDFRGDYQPDPNFCDEQPLVAQGFSQVGVPSQVDVASQGRVGMQQDERDCIPECTLLDPSGYIHPYTKERRPLVIPVESGTVAMSPCGDHLVYDLTVADANHYISSAGLVNKNTFMGFEESTNWPNLRPIDKMRATLRSAKGIPTKLILTANPGGAGHVALRDRFVSPARHGYVPILDQETGETRIFIPSRLEHNQILMKNDPNYERRLLQSGNEHIVKAWRYGDWDTLGGGFFDDLFNSDLHLVRPFEIPPTWRWRRSFDWGSASPASLGIWAISDGNPVEALDGFVFPRGSFIRVSEWYTCVRNSNGDLKPNEGLRLTNIALGNGIGIRSQDRNFTGCVADPSIFARLGREAIYDEIRKGALEVGHHLIFQPADNNRIAGWQRMRDMLEAAAQERPEKPGLWAFETCEHYARTIPVLQRDESNPDDIDTDQEDHVADEVRYLCATGARTLSIGTRRGE